MTALEKAIAIIGGPAAVARGLGIGSSMAVNQWKRRGLPCERVIGLSELTGYKVTPHELDPVHYPHHDDGLPENLRAGAA